MTESTLLWLVTAANLSLSCFFAAGIAIILKDKSRPKRKRKRKRKNTIKSMENRNE